MKGTRRLRLGAGVPAGTRSRVLCAQLPQLHQLRMHVHVHARAASAPATATASALSRPHSSSHCAHATPVPFSSSLSTQAHTPAPTTGSEPSASGGGGGGGGARAWESLPCLSSREFWWRELFGSPELATDKGHLYASWHHLRNQFGPLVRANLSNDEYLLCFDPELCKEVTAQKNAHRYERGPKTMINLMMGPAAADLFVLEGEAHGRERKVAMPAFSMRSLRSMVPQLQQSANEMISAIEHQRGSKSSLEMQAIIGAANFDAVTRTLLGVDFGVQRSVRSGNSKYPALLDDIHLVLDEFFGRTVHPLRKLNVMAHIRYKAAVARIQEWLAEAVARKRLQLDQDGGGADLWSIWLRQAKQSSSAEPAVTDQDIVDRSFLLLAAGHGNSSSALVSSFALLADHPQYQATLQAEADGVYAGSGEVLDLDRVKKLEFAEQCAWEAMRLYPPNSTTERFVKEQHTLGGYVIPRGVTISLPLHTLQTDASTWPEPHRYIPDRMSLEKRSSVHAASLMPFGRGIRSCIGNYLSLTQARIFLSTLARHYSWSYHPSHAPKRQSGAVHFLYPYDGHQLDFGFNPRLHGGLMCQLQPRSMKSAS